MVAPLAVGAVLGAVSLIASAIFGGTHDFVPGACDRIEKYISSELVGQELAVHQACDAVCDHLALEQPQKPLVLSAHGPPGVGKSLMHLLLARALYSKQPGDELSCPGKHCLGYKVLYGLDYVAADQGRQHELVREAVMEHIKYHPQSLIVIEEYDKLDCPTRALLRQLVDSPHSTNITISRSVILLESNFGYARLHRMVALGRNKVTPEAAQRMLKDLMFQHWIEEDCQSGPDIVKLLSLVDFYLPFLPLEREHIQQLFRRKLDTRRQDMMAAGQGQLEWDDDVVEFLVAKVDFEGRHPIEGAKEVRTLMTRYVTRSMRVWEAQQESGARREDRPRQNSQISTLRLEIAPGAKSLQIVKV